MRRNGTGIARIIFLDESFDIGNVFIMVIKIDLNFLCSSD